MTRDDRTPTVAELRARVTDKGPWFIVPAESQLTRCRSCGTFVYWIKTPQTGAAMQVDCDVNGGARPQRSEPDLSDDGSGRMVAPVDGRGVSHFATCPHSAQWRKSIKR